MTLTADDLDRAGWRRVLRLSVLPAGEEADKPYWRDPNGAVYSESAALAELREQAEEKKA